MVKKLSLVISYGGKGAQVRGKINGDLLNICKCWYNVDFSDGCISQVPVELLREVVNNNGKYLDGNFDIYDRKGILKNQKCGYCYGTSVNGGNVFPKIVNENTVKSFERYKPKEVRVGKFCESGHPYYYKTLIDFLGLCKEFGTKIIFTNKTLPFGIEGAKETLEYSENKNPIIFDIAKKVNMFNGEDLAEEIKMADMSLLYSLGNDRLEKGLVSQGFTNEWRIKQALAYHNQGVNVSLTIMCDVTQSIEDNEKKGYVIKSALSSRNKGINVRLLPLRPNTKRVAELTTGQSLKDITFSFQPVLSCCEESFNYPVVGGFEQRPFFKHRTKRLARFFHPDFQKLVGEGIGVCGTIGEKEYCDSCNLNYQRIVVPFRDIIPVKRKRKGRRGVKI